MLPQRFRLRKSAEFVSVMRRGRKVARPTLILYAREAASPHVGLIVSRQVGGAVQRNKVKRQLRHCAAGLVDESAPVDVVVRALPRAGAPSVRLCEDLKSAWAAAVEGVRS
ncbi:MAG: ribonuclease P protein component [Propionibacteriaceae bacterium]|nr:ribonuclease P protein component [Propionibacteriaceae bacterium]